LDTHTKGICRDGYDSIGELSGTLSMGEFNRRVCFSHAGLCGVDIALFTCVSRRGPSGLSLRCSSAAKESTSKPVTRALSIGKKDLGQTKFTIFLYFDEYFYQFEKFLFEFY